MGNYTTFHLPTFCETFLPKIIKIQICILELQLKMSGILFMVHGINTCSQSGKPFQMLSILVVVSTSPFTTQWTTEGKPDLTLGSKYTASRASNTLHCTKTSRIQTHVDRFCSDFWWPATTKKPCRHLPGQGLRNDRTPSHTIANMSVTNVRGLKTCSQYMNWTELQSANSNESRWNTCVEYQPSTIRPSFATAS